MAYRDLRSIFHDQSRDYESEYRARRESACAVELGISVSGHPAFFVMAPDVYEAALAASRLDKQISKLVGGLPGKAVTSYMESCLIDEIVITNEIEGVNSTRREISEILDRLESDDKRGRFRGLVQKYLMLCGGREIPVRTPEDVRSIYDELVLDEVAGSDPKNVPDGRLFRAGPVSVLNAAGIPIHAGVEPEGSIVSCMERALGLLNDGSVVPLARIAAFHFAFGYIHPFYDGNGRTNRFISSYAISQEYEPIVGFRLSYAVKESISKYYRAFTTCEHPLCRGDVTPFVIAFSEIVVSAMESMRRSLAERLESMRSCEEAEAALSSEIGKPWAESLVDVLVNAALFSANGITAAELSEMFGTSRQTTYSRLGEIRDRGLLVQERVGRKTYCRMDVEALKGLFRASNGS